MDDIDDIPNQIFISLKYKFKAVRVFGMRLNPVQFDIKVDAMLAEDETDNASDTNVAIEKIRYWMDKVVNHSILFSSANEWAYEALLGTETGLPVDNNVILCPEEPTDSTIAELLLCKMKALSGNAFDFGAIEIQSSDSRGLDVTFMGKPGTDFPAIEDWVGERTFFSKPWWHRDDASSLDVTPADDDDLSVPPDFAFSLGFIADKFGDSEEAEKRVVRAEFRPTLIQGGKKD
jgi:hypothetical protein